MRRGIVWCQPSRRLQDELSALRHEVNEPTAPLSMGQRADAAVHLAGLAAGLGNLKRTIKREGTGCRSHTAQNVTVRPGERLNLGAPLYREIAKELASDDPQVIDPIWLNRSPDADRCARAATARLAASTRHAVA